MTAPNPEPRTLNPTLALLTPPGRGAVATIGVRGAGAAGLVSRRFTSAAGKPLTEFPVGRVVFGRFRTGATVTEELVVGLVAANEVEIHCHGGSAAVAAIQEVLIQEGCLPIAPSRWAHETETDNIAADALLALGLARTERTAAVLLDQYRGAIRQEIFNIEHQLRQNQIHAAAQALHQLRERADFGLHLTQPWKIVIAGRPNAGKSSLMNAIVGYQRAIVFPEPGTTRDVLTATTALDGWPVELADTAGLRAPGDSLEAEGIARAMAQVKAGDLVLFIAETTAAWDAALYDEVSQQARNLLVVHNKCDLSPPPDDGRSTGQIVSAKAGTGIDELCQAIAHCLASDPPPRGAAVPFTAEQVAALAEVERLLAQGRIEESHTALAMLTKSLPGTQY